MLQRVCPSPIFVDVSAQTTRARPRRSVPTVGLSTTSDTEITLGGFHLVRPTGRAETAKQNDRPEQDIDDHAATALPSRSIPRAAPPLVLVGPLTGYAGRQPETAERARPTGNRAAQRSEITVLRPSRLTPDWTGTGASWLAPQTARPKTVPDLPSHTLLGELTLRASGQYLTAAACCRDGLSVVEGDIKGVLWRLASISRIAFSTRGRIRTCDSSLTIRSTIAKVAANAASSVGARSGVKDRSCSHGGDSEHSFVTGRLYRLGACEGSSPYSPCLSRAGGSEAARAPVPRGEIFVVGVDGRGRQNLTRTAAFESELALSPDGRRIAYVRSDGIRSQVWVMNVDGSGQQRLTSGGEDDLPLARHTEFWPQWSPDGRRLAYMVWDYAACTPVSGSGCAAPDVWTVDADGSGQRKILDNAFQPGWSADGSMLLFQRYEANPDRATLGVYLARSDGIGVRQLVQAPLWGSGIAPPAWSPTGRTIVYVETFGPQYGVRLSTVTADGLGGRTLTSGWAPAWAPDGSRIAFARTNGIWVIPSRGRPRRIAAASARHTVPFPAWSPAGKQVAYNSGNQLYVARVDGRSTKLVTEGATCTCVGCCRVSPPVWSRNGRHLYYSG
jgi:Tol biopolymer transport system component